MNLNKLSKLAPLATLACLAQGAPALADLPANVWVSCQTTSQGRTFRDADYGTQNARARTINGCTNDYATNNGECRYNVSCDGDIPGEYARCTTTSQGRTFRDGGLDPNATRESVIASCTRDYATNNGECRYNVSCQGGYAPVPVPVPPPYYPPTPPTPPTPPPYYPPVPPTPPTPPADGDNQQVVCSTSSNGRNFSVPGHGYQATLAKVVYVCQMNQFTDKAACQYNAYCQ